jgi:MFS family permease
MGAAVLVILVAVAHVLRRDPQALGLLPDNGRQDSRETATAVREPGVPMRKAARMREFWTICMAEFTIFFCLLTMIVHIVPYATDRGLPPATAAGVLATIGGVSMLGRAVMGVANDRIGGKRSLIICFIILLGGLIWLQVAREAWMLFLFAPIYGFAHGGFFTVVSPTVAELFGTDSHGLLFGVVLANGTVGGAIGPLLAGTTFDITGSYHFVFLTLTVLAVAGLILIALWLPPQGAGNAR